MLKLIENKRKRILAVAICVAIIVGAFFIGMNVPWKKQAPIYDVFRQTGVLILGVIGAWLAVLLPFSVEKNEKLKNFFNFSKKLFPALSSAIYLLCIGLFVPIFIDIIGEYSCIYGYGILIFNGSTMSILALGAILAVYGFLMILASFDALKNDIYQKSNAQEVREKVGPKKKL